MGLPVGTDQSAMKSALNVTGTVAVNRGSGFVFTLSNTTAAATSIYDAPNAAGAVAANLIATTPASSD